MSELSSGKVAGQGRLMNRFCVPINQILDRYGFKVQLGSPSAAWVDISQTLLPCLPQGYDLVYSPPSLLLLVRAQKGLQNTLCMAIPGTPLDVVPQLLLCFHLQTYDGLKLEQHIHGCILSSRSDSKFNNVADAISTVLLRSAQLRKLAKARFLNLCLLYFLFLLSSIYSIANSVSS